MYASVAASRCMAGQQAALKLVVSKTCRGSSAERPWERGRLGTVHQLPAGLRSGLDIKLHTAHTCSVL